MPGISAAQLLGAIGKIAVDATPLRRSRDLRLLLLGNFITGLGTQATLVALPYQVYVQTRSPFLTGLLGICELLPLVAMSLYGGALADRVDRRKLLLADQLALVGIAAALCAGAALGSPPLGVLYALAGLLAGFGAIQNVARSAIVPNLVAPGQLRGALALNFGLYQLTMVLGPGLGGILIAATGLPVVYALDALSCLGMTFAVLLMSPQPPQGVVTNERHAIGRSIADGLRFVMSKNALLGSFGIDLMAMCFGMPRALFAVLSLTVYHAGASGTGALYASLSAGATVAALSTGWLTHVRRLGRVVIVAVAVWGAAIALAGAAGSLWLAMVMLAVAGAADSISAVCRSTINQLLTPDLMRGRMSSVFSVVVTSGPRLGDVESGTAAALLGVQGAVVSGGLLCVLGAGLFVGVFGALFRFDADRDTEPQDDEAPAGEPAVTYVT